MQILDDWLSVSGLSEAQSALRNKLVSSLKIDCVLRRGDYAKFYSDLETAKADYSQVLEICAQHPEGNERIQGSAFFSLGKIHLDANERVQALEYFKKV